MKGALVGESVSPELEAAVAEVLKSLLIMHATKAEKVTGMKMKVTGQWIKEMIRIEIK